MIKHIELLNLLVQFFKLDLSNTYAITLTKGSLYVEFESHHQKTIHKMENITHVGVCFNCYVKEAKQDAPPVVPAIEIIIDIIDGV